MEGEEGESVWGDSEEGSLVMSLDEANSDASVQDFGLDANPDAVANDA